MQRAQQPSVTSFSLLKNSNQGTSEELSRLMLSNPDQFMSTISKNPDYLLPSFANKLDEADPLKETRQLFNIDKLNPFAGHSLGPIFKPVVEGINATTELQKQLHAGHFPTSHPEGKSNGHWFDCDRHEPSLRGAQQLLGFAHDDEFIFTANGLSDNLGKLLDTFFRPGLKGWQSGKTQIAMLATDFFSDQAIAVSVAERAIATAVGFEVFDSDNAPNPESLILKIQPDENGIYKTEDIIETIKKNASKIQVLCLSDIVFSTGQRLDLNRILSELKDVIEENHIIVGLDLAHTIGNRAINLSGMPVPIHFAVACGYKHLCGYAGSGFGIYVNRNCDLKKYPPIKGWKAADPSKVFATIHHYDASIMSHTGAVAFRTSNPPPVALLPVQAYLSFFGKIGFDQCFSKSECLTRYLIAQLQHKLSDVIEFVSPLQPEQRGAMIVFRVKGLEEVKEIEEILKQHGYEIDVRPPNNIRLTAHYAYTKFEQIAAMVNELNLVIREVLQHKNQNKLGTK